MNMQTFYIIQKYKQKVKAFILLFIRAFLYTIAKIWYIVRKITSQKRI